MKKDQGQIAIGLAFAFTAILALFGLVFNSSVITREKMKLQQTTDFAALVAADVQRRNLNKIRELNQEIEAAYLTTVPSLIPSYCSLFGLVSPTDKITTTAAAATITGSTPATCDQACDAIDNFTRDQYIKIYETFRTLKASEIFKIVMEANDRAFDRALDTFLTPQNLPFGLKRVLENRYGSSLTSSALKSEYNNGKLKESLEISDSNRDIPLFIPAHELRAFIYPDYFYADGVCAAVVVPYACCYLPSPSKPGFTMTNAKIVKDGDFTTSFLIQATYTPPATEVDKRFALHVQNPKARNASSRVLEDISGKKLPLFRTQTLTGTVAYAKPYGGTFPKVGVTLDPSSLNVFDLLNPTNILGLIAPGPVGDEFTGAKLIGLADTQEVGGIPPFKEATIERKDADGIVKEIVKVYVEDFLH